METIQKILKKPITATFIAIILGFLVAAGALAVAGYDRLHRAVPGHLL